MYIDRGGCTFMDKALRAQAAGAVGLIIGNIIEPMGVFMMVRWCPRLRC